MTAIARLDRPGVFVTAQGVELEGACVFYLEGRIAVPVGL
jgi:hypothetical protein